MVLKSSSFLHDFHTATTHPHTYTPNFYPSMAYPALQVDFNNPITEPEGTQITEACLTFRNNTQVLTENQCNQATVYR